MGVDPSPKGRGLESGFFFNPFWPQVLRIWVFLAWPPGSLTGQKGREGDRSALGRKRARVSVVILTGRPEGTRACARRHQAGTGVRPRGGRAGAPDGVPLPGGAERAGGCISQLGRNQCNGPFRMCIKILRIPHFNIKYS